MFANPVASHYVSYAEKLPLLSVIYNNNRRGAVQNATLRLNPDAYAARRKREPLTYFDGDAKYERAVEICDGHGPE